MKKEKITMSLEIIEGIPIVTFGSVDCAEDLKPQPGISINHPAWCERCECCGRHVSELKPFGGPGDPLRGDFTGELLLCVYRPFGPFHEGAEKIFREAEKRYKDEGYKDVYEYLEYEYGPEDAEEIDSLVLFYHAHDKSWECRDCAVLDDDEYFEELRQSGN
jgi:hypothetical protein